MPVYDCGAPDCLPCIEAFRSRRNSVTCPGSLGPLPNPTGDKAFDKLAAVAQEAMNGWGAALAERDRLRADNARLREAHDDLMAALREAVEKIEYFCDDMNFMPDDTAKLLNKASAALAKAGVT